MECLRHWESDIPTSAKKKTESLKYRQSRNSEHIDTVKKNIELSSET